MYSSLVYPLYLIPGQAKLFKLVIKQDPGAGSGLTIDEKKRLVCHIRQSFNSLGITLGHNQPLLSHHKIDQMQLHIRKIFFKIRNIIGPILRPKQVGTPHVTGPLFNGHKSPHAAHMT